MKRTDLKMLVLSAALGAAVWPARAQEDDPTDPVDESVKAAPDPQTMTGDPILRWYRTGNERKKYTPPAGVNPKMFARVVFGADHPGESVIAFSSETRNITMPPKDTYFIHRAGLSRGMLPRKKKKGKAGGWPTFKPGETSPWVDITSALHYGYTEMLRVEPRLRNGKKLADDVKRTSFRIEFSTDGKTVAGAFPCGGGRFACGTVNLKRGEVKSDVELSGMNLARAQRAGRDAPKRPKRFMAGIANHLSPDKLTPAAYTNELKVLRLLGVNDAHSPMNAVLDPTHEHEPEFLRRTLRIPNRNKCLCSPDYESITNTLRRFAAANAAALARGRKFVLTIMDEPFFKVSFVKNCRSKVKTCRERYGRDFCFDPARPKEHFDTVTFRDRIVAGYFKAITDAARAIHPNLLVSANVGISMVFGGNASSPGTSPFMLTDAKAIGIGLTEDWCNWQRTRQFSSYLSDVYRAATTRHGLDFVLFSIILSPPETGAKAFSEVGHGVKGIYFFGYGPHWLGGDSRNYIDGMYPVVRAFCEATAAAEDGIVGATVAKGDAALLFSESCDKMEIVRGNTRERMERNPFGKERMCSSLMLSHCGVRTDVLCEDDVVRKLAEYKVLVATDGRVHRACAEAIAAWMRAGGVLVRTKDALKTDELDRPFPADFFAKAGKTVEIGFSPWRDYVFPARRVPGACYSHRTFDGVVLEKMAAVVREAKISRRIHSDHPLVEAMLLENAKNGKSVVVLANWSPQTERRVTVTLNAPPRFTTVRSARGAEVRHACTDGVLTLSLDIGLGDYIVLE